MGDITLGEIRTLLEKLGLGRSFKEQEPLLFWPEVVGPQMSRLTEALRVREGVLYVEAANHVVAQQLRLMSEMYLKKLNALLGEPLIREIRFRVGSSFASRRRLPRSEESELESEPEQLSLLEREKLSKLLDEVEDPKLRKAFEGWILASLRQDQARRAQGGHRCPRCGVHHHEDDEICYYCRLEEPASPSPRHDP
jgi:hypothetical protein